MTTRLSSLEAQIQELARAFASQLVDAAFRANVTDLSALLDAGLPTRRDLAQERPTVAAGTRLPTAGPASLSRANHATAASPTRTGGGVRPTASRPKPPARRRSVTSAERRVDVYEDDADAGGSTITDPSLLLEVLSAVPSSTRNPLPPETSRTVAPSKLLEMASPAKVDARGSSEGTPALRPGERLQRTAGGGVVLRRGSK